MTPTEAARIVDRAIATKAAAVGCWSSRSAWCSLSRANRRRAPGNVYRHGEPEVGGYAAAWPFGFSKADRLKVPTILRTPAREPVHDACQLRSADMVQAIREDLKKIGKQVAATMQTDINAPIEAVFDFVAAEEVLPKVLTG